ncbi:MEMO1 family [Pyronema domesticum]|uniref:Similar to Protein MEMO1 acc. no. Q803S3 n=1 Tax=Pyronema omphalodes (strain CBS 100304) TaxID=1076935 RepID=U4LQ15_PYROM|nr:MEMO1 family [Pyronema domesticum]CCX31415.1 Similar to Protein MEMO1; acc. no. Q803S3 [Pyronema omphalodes CBS 100304]
MTTRRATHADNAWYTKNGPELNSQLENWLQGVDRDENIRNIEPSELPLPGARIIIAPHAGYAYSGAPAGWAYKSLDLSTVKRIFILGPSHHVYFTNCKLSACDYYATPLGNLTLDKACLADLSKTKTPKFDWMSQSEDEREHSIEMQLPYIYKLLSDANKLDTVKIVPIMIGNISDASEKAYGKILAEYAINPENAFVVSTDFCHWGTRFQYTHYYKKLPSCCSPGETAEACNLSRGSSVPGSHEIHESIKELDFEGINAVLSGSHDNFLKYLHETKNTICGRHPVGVMMATLEAAKELDREERRFTLVEYKQSSQVTRISDSSVSYVSAFAVV